MLMAAAKASAIALAAALVLTQPVDASELTLPKSVAHSRVHNRVYTYEDACGCFHWTLVRHRERLYTYGWGFDPRSFDMTEPYFYLGRMKTYVRYW